VFFDALRVKIRDEGLVRNKAVHIALGVRADGAKEILKHVVSDVVQDSHLSWVVIPCGSKENCDGQAAADCPA